MKTLALCAIVMAEPSSAEQLRIGLLANAPPSSIALENGDFFGFDYDLMREVCRLGGYTCHFSMHEMTTLLNQLEAGELDVALGGIGSTIARGERFELTCVYRAATNPTGYLYGLTGVDVPTDPVVAVDADTLHEDGLKSAGIDYVAFEGDWPALVALTEGEVDLYFGRSDVISLFSDRHPPVEIVSQLPLATAGSVMLVTKGETGRRNRLDELIGTFIRNDGYEVLIEQHPTLNGTSPGSCDVQILGALNINEAG